ncbi:MAG: hypothetical protein Q4C74_07345 [Rothia sp. (in: high G+C Gram-positive bacteria)]|nr:hypothetical protein [Rothia sp. (in: high G+C Gram-positive bacteria)]
MACRNKAAKAQKAAEKTLSKAENASGKKAEKLAKLYQDQAAKAHRFAEKQASRSSKKIESLQHSVSPAVEDMTNKARHKAGEVASAVAQKISDVEIPAQAEHLIEKAGGNKKALKNAQKQAVKAAKAYAKEQKKAARIGGGRKGLICLGLLATAALAGFAAYKASRPVEDPWKTPSSV